MINVPKEKLWFMPVVDDEHFLPFYIKISDNTPFSKVLTKAIRELAKSNKSLLNKEFDISTMSADLMLKQEDFDMKVSEIKEKYATNFTIRRGTMFKVSL